MLGAGDPASIPYRGANADRLADGTLKLHHETYFKKVKPMTIPKHLGPESELSSKEILHFVGCLEPFNGLRFNLHHAFKQARPSSLDQSVVVW